MKTRLQSCKYIGEELSLQSCRLVGKGGTHIQNDCISGGLTEPFPPCSESHFYVIIWFTTHFFKPKFNSAHTNWCHLSAYYCKILTSNAES